MLGAQTPPKVRRRLTCLPQDSIADLQVTRALLRSLTALHIVTATHTVSEGPYRTQPGLYRTHPESLTNPQKQCRTWRKELLQLGSQPS